MDSKKIEALEAKDPQKVKKLFKLFKNEEAFPYYLDLPDYIDLLERIDETIEIIKTSTSARLIVLEAWLLVDFSIKHHLENGLNISKFQDDNFDILPFSFRMRCDLLKKLVFTQLKKKELPIQENKTFRYPIDFHNMFETDTELFNTLVKIETEYNRTLGTPSKYYSKTMFSDPNYRQVDNSWLSFTQNLGDDWYKKIDTLNNARNEIAHSLSEDSVYTAIGISGKDNSKKLKALKTFCLETLQNTLGLNKEFCRLT